MNAIFTMEDLLNVLIELEKMGNRNYVEMARKTVNSKLRDYFERLAEQELEHKSTYEVYKALFVNFEHNQLTEEYISYMNVLLSNTVGMLKSATDLNDIIACYNMAISLEKDTILLLTELKKLVPEYRHADIEKLINEERQHLKLLHENPLD